MIPKEIQSIFDVVDCPPKIPSKEWRQILKYYYEDAWSLSDRVEAKHREQILDDLQQLHSGTPLAYVTGKSHFYGRVFSVRKGVLIPRPETEELVEWAKNNLPENSRVLDMGCGSGCIALSLGLERPDLQISAMDASEIALEVTRNNAEQWNLQVNLFKDDMLHPSEFLLQQSWDAIISNPPYVRPSETSSSILHEPKRALFTPEEDPLLYYRSLRDYAERSLSSEGQIFLELSEFFAKETQYLFEGSAWDQCTLRSDLQGKLRMLCAKKA